MPSLSRRHFLAATAAAVLSPSGRIVRCAEPARKKLPVAGVTTVYRPNSHADVIIGKVVEGWRQDGGPGPDLELVSLYTDQVPEGETSRELAKKHGFKIAGSIAEALTLGGDKLAVEGVICVGEHGQYPEDPATHQTLYPRRRFFDEIVAVYKSSGRVVPLFSDKHLSAYWADAKHMNDTARAMNIPFMAGSSLPVTWRKPPVTLPRESKVEELMMVGYGPLDHYGFHAAEGLQCFAERRAGGETGVKSVQGVSGEAIWQTEKEGRWTRSLLEKALTQVPTFKLEDWTKRLTPDALFYLVEYKDGTRGCIAMANGAAAEFSIAVKLKDQPAPVATWFMFEEYRPFGHFEHLLRGIEHMMHTGKPAWPVERTLLTGGILDVALHSAAAKGERRATPELEFSYPTVDWPFAQGEPPKPAGG